jgi:hypothetical protein
MGKISENMLMRMQDPAGQLNLITAFQFLFEYF